MTHTSTEQPEALRLADDRPLSLNDDLYQWAYDAELMLRRLHARVQELEAENAHLKDAAWTAIDALEASQAQRVPHNKTHAYEDHKKYPGACRHCGYAEHEPLQHGITQEKQG